MKNLQLKAATALCASALLAGCAATPDSTFETQPYVTNGNIYAPVMMIAEKAADLIRGNTPLAPEPLPYYRSNE